MSPRRKVAPDDVGWLITPKHKPQPRVRWDRPLVAVMAIASLLAGTAITLCALMLYSHETHRRAALQDAAVLADVRSIMTDFVSPDPTGENGANRYVDTMTAHATGEFAQFWRDQRNQTLVQIAVGPKLVGGVLDIGVDRWNDDGSVNVLVVTKAVAKSADGKDAGEQTDWWLATATKEAGQWKISRLSPLG